MSAIDFPFLYIPNPTKGRPLFDGQIFVGIPDLDPEVPENQKQLSVIQEDGTLVPVDQPFILSSGGVPIYNGSTVRLDVDGDYSLKILDKLGAQKYFIENSFDSEPLFVVTSRPPESVTLTASQTAVTFPTVNVTKAEIFLTSLSGDRGRIFKDGVDYEEISSTEIELNNSQSAGTICIAEETSVKTAAFSEKDLIKKFNTLSDAKASNKLTITDVANITIGGSTSFWDVVSSSSFTANGLDIVEITNDSTILLKLIVDANSNEKMFGAVNGQDATAAIQRYLDISLTINTDGDYIISSPLLVRDGTRWKTPFTKFDYTGSSDCIQLEANTVRNLVSLENLDIVANGYVLTFIGGFETTPFGYKHFATPVSGAGVKALRVNDSTYGAVSRLDNVRVSGFAKGFDLIGFNASKLFKCVAFGCTSSFFVVGQASQAANAFTFEKCNAIDTGTGFDVSFITTLSFENCLTQRCTDNGIVAIGNKAWSITNHYAEYNFPSVVRLDSNIAFNIDGNFFFGNRFSYREFTTEGDNRFNFAGNGTTTITHNVGTTSLYVFEDGIPNNGISRTANSVTFSTNTDPGLVYEFVTKQDIQSGGNYGLFFVEDNKNGSVMNNSFEEMLQSGTTFAGTGDVLITGDNNFADSDSVVTLQGRAVLASSVKGTDETLFIDSLDPEATDKFVEIRGRTRMILPLNGDFKIFGGSIFLDENGGSYNLQDSAGTDYAVTVDTSGRLLINGTVVGTQT